MVGLVNLGQKVKMEIEEVQEKMGVSINIYIY